jgi:hypothetical protein
VADMAVLESRVTGPGFLFIAVLFHFMEQRQDPPSFTAAIVAPHTRSSETKPLAH